jgi:hypothetical protein
MQRRVKRRLAALAVALLASATTAVAAPAG